MIDEVSSRYNTARPSGKVEAINAVLPHLVRMRDKVERAEYAAQIADRLKVDSRIIRDELKRAATNRQSSLNANRTRAAQQTTQAECQLLELVLARADVRKAVTSNLSHDDVTDLATERVFVAVMELEKRQADPTYESLSALLQEDSEREMVAGLLISDLAWAGCDDFDTLFKKATEAITSLRLRKLERRLDAIQMALGQAERERNEDLWVRLYQEKAEVKRRMLGMSA
jgi:DNA primase